VQGERLFQVCLFAERHAHMAAIDLPQNPRVLVASNGKRERIATP
jgi:hypothetical protein